MKKYILLILFLLLLVVGICFATDFITLSDYEKISKEVSVDRQTASTLISRVNTLLTNVRATGVTITSAARASGSPTLHPKSRAVDLRWDINLYNNIVTNIGGSGLRVECIDCIRQNGEAEHIHLDIGGPNGEGLPLGRFFHINHEYNIPTSQHYINLTTYGMIVRKENYYALKLHRPITFTEGRFVETIDTIQLLFYNNTSNYDINRSYYIYGRLSFWETAHHYTPIILAVERVY
jgi:hypothetical protein